MQELQKSEAHSATQWSYLWRDMFYKRGCRSVIRESILSFELESIALGAGSLHREIQDLLYLMFCRTACSLSFEEKIANHSLTTFC